MAAAAGILSVVSGVFQAVGAIQSANAAAASAKYNQQVAERNELIARQNRQIAIQTSQIAADDQRRDNRRQLAAIRASYGASGVDLAGSPLAVLEDSATEMELDAQRTEYEGLVKGREGALQVIEQKDKQQLYKMEAKNAKTKGYGQAFGYLLSAGKSLI